MHYTDPRRFLRWAMLAAACVTVAACGGADEQGGNAAPSTAPDPGATPARASSPTASGLGGSGPTNAPVTGNSMPRGQSVFVSGSGNDAAAGSRTRPWRTLARVQAHIDRGLLRAGDAVMLQRGHRYAGSLTLGSSLVGTTGSPILFAAYGSGAAPVIDGMLRVSGWHSLGGGRWRATCHDCTGTPAMLRLDGKLQRIARWPNLDEADGGYRYFTATNGSNRLSDANLPASANWSGGEAVVRSIAWVLDRLPITGHGPGGELTLGASASYPLELGYGYFVQNHPNAIDLEGEWAYDAATRTVTLQSATDPNARVVEVPAPGDRVTVRGAQHVELRDLVIEGAGRHAVDGSACTGLKLTRTRIAVVGDTALRLEGCSDLSVQDSVFEDSANNGIAARNCPGCRVQRTTVQRTGMFAGMGGSGDGAYVAVSLGGAPSRRAELSRLVVRDSGYIGIDVPLHATLAGSLVERFNQVKVDGSGIYMWHGSDVTLVDNTVLDAGGSTAGTPWQSTGTHGIYLDDDSERITVLRNTVGRVGAAGIYLHNTRDVEIAENLIFGAAEAGVLMVDDPLGTYGVERTQMRGNTLIGTGIPMIEAWSTQSTTFFDTLGTIDGNRYCDPFADPFMRAAHAAQSLAAMSIAQWRAAGRDMYSSVCVERQSPYSISGSPGASQVANGTFDSDLSGWFGWPSDTLDARWETGRLDGGSLRLGFAGPSPQVHFDAPIGAVAAGQAYLFELDTLAVTGAPSIDAYLRQSGPPYERLGASVTVLPGPSRTAHSLLLRATQDHADALLILEMRRAGTAAGIDSVRLRPVTATARTLRDAARLETNPSPKSRSFTLDAPHAGLDGSLLPAGTVVTLAPHRSIVLFRR